MKQVRHKLYEAAEPLDDKTALEKMEHIFEWANNVGRKGRMVTMLDTKPEGIFCMELVTDDDYQRMLANGEIVEEAKENKEELPEGAKDESEDQEESNNPS